MAGAGREKRTEAAVEGGTRIKHAGPYIVGWMVKIKIHEGCHGLEARPCLRSSPERMPLNPRVRTSSPSLLTARQCGESMLFVLAV